jgi:hypothetical protein
LRSRPAGTYSAQHRTTLNGPVNTIDVRLPVFVKPFTRRQERWEAVADAKAIHAESEAELSLLPARLADNVGGVLIQAGSCERIHPVTDSQEVTALGREISRRLDLRGVAKLDFKRGPEGRLSSSRSTPA